METKVVSFSNVAGTTINRAAILAFVAGGVVSVSERSANWILWLGFFVLANVFVINLEVRLLSFVCSRVRRALFHLLSCECMVFVDARVARVL